MGNELSRISEPPDDRPLDVQEIRARVNLIQHLLRGIMKKEVHYGLIPGCGDKPTLLKAGAEKISVAFRIDGQVQQKTIDIGGGHREVHTTVEAYSQVTGKRLGSGIGVCSTMESRYRYRWDPTGREVPRAYWENRDPDILGGPQFAPRKRGGRWEIFQKVEHPDPADYYNTVSKMSEKRARVDMILNVTGASDIFTQDIEDNPEVFRDEPETPPAKSEPPKTQARKAAPEPEPEDAFEEPSEVEDDGNSNVVRGKVENVVKKSGKNKKGEWTLYGIKIGGEFYNTFDERIGKYAIDARDHNAEIELKYEIMDFNGRPKRNALDIKVVRVP